jgi:hypothetical protein
MFSPFAGSENMAGDVRVQKASKVLDEEIAALREQVALARKRRPRQSSANDVAEGPASAGASTSGAAVPVDETNSAEQGGIEQTEAGELLRSRLKRLEQIQEWITIDGDLLPLIARVAGNVESKFLRRNLVLNVVLSTIFLIAGWLLSTVATPIDLGHIFRP